MDVFSFGITRIPKAIKAFFEKEGLSDEDIDQYIFHQANKFMNEKIRKKIGAPEDKVPYTLYDYANVSSATIPLTITEAFQRKNDASKILCCGFGVGLSWGIAYFELNKDTLLNTIEL
jgi:3-oxoacyl-[acyl-carrier-protein] synthase-3